MDFEKYLTKQAEQHPSMQAQDAVKLCYQAAFGAEHLLSDTEAAARYFDREYAEVCGKEQEIPGGDAIYEPVSEEYARVNLPAWKRSGLPANWLFQMFVMTASEKATDGEQRFRSYMAEVRDLAEAGMLPFSEKEWEDYRQMYEECGGGAVHHSESYREKEQPAYRIVHRRYVRLIPLLQKLAFLKENSKEEKEAWVLAIDGRAAAGKSTLAEDLRKILGGSVIHVDDFFLPPELRTEERLLKAGGNVHYERFLSEVIPHLGKKRKFSYVRFDCGKMMYGEAVEVPETEWQIVEGSYSCHPVFGEYMDLRIFLTVSEEKQWERITARNGERMAEMFKTRWIPMEEKYFKTYGIGEKAAIKMEI